jgi:subtilisin family serine protease
MASPVVSGTIALMLQANPSLTPTLVKAILEFTAETHVEYTGLVQGAGFLNARGAVELAQKMAAGIAFDAGTPQDDPTPWGRHVIWGNTLVGGDALAAVALSSDVAWGASAVAGTDLVSTAGSDGESDRISWGTNALGAAEDLVWSPIRKTRQLPTPQLPTPQLPTPQLPTPNSQFEDLGVVRLGVVEFDVLEFGFVEFGERGR